MAEEPPTYDAAINYGTTVNNLNVTEELPCDVTVKEPTGYIQHGEPSSAPMTSITAGGLRLDKAIRIGDRLIIDFEKIACCPWQTVGLDKDCRNYIPEELRLKGITQDMWEEWCDKLMKHQKKATSIAGCLCLFCFPGFIPQCILCAIFCPISADHPLKFLPCCYGDWYVGLNKWQREVNRVLNPKDMHAKLRTYKPFQK